MLPCCATGQRTAIAKKTRSANSPKFEGTEQRLTSMVRTGVDRRNLIRPSRKSTRNHRRQNAVLRGLVQTLEEREHRRVRHGCGTETRELLDDDVGVSDDEPLAVELLRCGVVVGVGVDEEAGVEVLDGELDGEIFVGWDGASVGGEDELGG